ncbi:tRNA pseudouridine(38-40) synthase TruA [Saliterribacillus persicus]|uniref:tRNA pseudouridine synthase A n=1 Tax=Saliterribacillus persicus TaxID=930114 RepID=A0A368X6C8_9BACI|nr:tRNA pseudouridine(38-40) synthase TruA [Saliterribacillus persicus]RCW63540.1 tRNA pseudouridine38-40 synthase [Saliterribacillus persicus]
MRYKAVISYDGSNFSGYQIQPKQRTVQGEVEKALSKMHKGLRITVHASGRTDRGVHALGQVLHFDSDLQIPLDNWKRALTAILPDDINVKRIEPVKDDFHARYDVIEKEYRYELLVDDEPNIFLRHYKHHVAPPINVKAMQEACKYLIGTHDFSSFCAAKATVKGDKIRTVYAASFLEKNTGLIFRIAGSGFLYNMVRIIVGTLVDIGYGKLKPEDMKKIIEKKERKAASKTAPPQGLYLYQVKYDE